MTRRLSLVANTDLLLCVEVDMENTPTGGIVRPNCHPCHCAYSKAEWNRYDSTPVPWLPCTWIAAGNEYSAPVKGFVHASLGVVPSLKACSTTGKPVSLPVTMSKPN